MKSWRCSLSAGPLTKRSDGNGEGGGTLSAALWASTSNENGGT
jgi:hypothetical protein